ncbi:phytanoyl-CoA dioxygenase family protein [Bailinhaonella thermotolerans]|uniref:Phytanoyl-CoA dioxygenase n=1 Tax=Bailinhaonella thermotolerans TaxID=1070861 RepID=A0A3A4AUJ1_9ACTN|nr:phytanoyl-CoA dioxygenase family protein [Bailinhaonella thermotolerans]RJL31955.1 phytanoyl-CoA dioxygenase [Bailinhaonella thermotolerans]
MNVDQFVRDGFVKVEGAFPAELAAECREILWRDTGCDPDDPSTWKNPVVRLGDHADEPFRKAANTPELHAAFDLLVGKDRWWPRGSLGTVPVRFPSEEEPGDDGWHIEASFAPEDPAQYHDYLNWRANVRSRDRALLMLFLFSEVGPDDAPTRIRAGSHLTVARLLEPLGEAGASILEFSPKAEEATRDLPTALATGRPGDVYLCHPFLVHAAQPHHGTRPRFMAQPPLFPREQLSIDRADGAYSPVEAAIRLGLGR